MNLVECFYCSTWTPPARTEKDHFPVPARHGGVATVVACQTCHDLKDRVPLMNWEVRTLLLASEELTKHGLLRFDSVDQSRNLPEAWRSLSGPARVMWAKISWLYQDAPERVAELMAS